MSYFRKITLACAVSVFTLTGVLAQTATPDAQQTAPYTPTVGQEGKDVIWVPTPQALVDEMMKMASVTSEDYVVDLGSGDGRTVITAAKLGARAHGIEYNPDLVELSKRNAREAGVEDRATFEQADIFESDFSDATVITLFLLSELNLRLRPILLDMEPGTRVVSNTFNMGDWQPDRQVEASNECTSYCNAYMWTIPAKVEGTWEIGEGELELTQTYQMLSGTLTQNGQTTTISDARMTGRTITFTAGESRYTGEVQADGIISGTIEGGSNWTANRSAG